MSDDFDSEQADEQERAEAEALAAALDGKPHAQDAPEDALAAALLMRHGGSRGELSAERSEAILGALLRDTRPAAQARADEPAPHASEPTAVPAAPAARSAKLVRLWPLAAGFATAAAIALAWLGAETMRSGPSTAAVPTSVAATPAEPARAQPLPPASVQLLAARSALLREGLRGARPGVAPQGAATGETEAAARFERELRAYRAELLRALRTRYPAKLGLLAPRAEAPADGADLGREGWRRSR